MQGCRLPRRSPEHATETVCTVKEAAAHQVSIQATVMLAVAFPSTRWTTFTPLAAIHTLAQARHAAVG